ncbi:Integrase catalytic core [Penicillium sp. CMV-2018d]|nr:Integrase catalytic core [Penicillium sp. CMV-2018d]
MTGRRRSCTTSRKVTGACPWYGSQTETRGLSRVSGRALRTKPLYTAAYHPSADGQSERSNQTAEIWLRHWQNLHQDVDWNEGLAPMHEHGLQSQFQQAIGHILCHVHWLPAQNYEGQGHEYDWPTSERRIRATAIRHRFCYKYTKSNRGIKSSARHPVSFRRPLRPWPHFITDIEHTHQRHVWGRSVIQVDLVSRSLNDKKSLLMKRNIGQVLGIVLEVQSLNICFADFKAAGMQYNKTPDMVMLSKPDQQNQNAQCLRVEMDTMPEILPQTNPFLYWPDAR